MDLKTFVEEALCQIAEAMESNMRCLQKIEFDVAVTAAETGRKDGGLSISVLTAKIQGEASSESVNSSVSRIRFQVVAQLPQARLEDR